MNNRCKSKLVSLVHLFLFLCHASIRPIHIVLQDSITSQNKNHLPIKYIVTVITVKTTLTNLQFILMKSFFSHIPTLFSR